MEILKGPILIVDGYNIIGAWEDLKALQSADFGSARDQLSSILSAFYPWSWERIIIVYDGKRYDWQHVDGLEVVFTECSETADTLIERLTAGLSPYYQVTVATSDSAEYRAASALGASVLSAKALKERLAELQNSYRHRLAEPAAKGKIMLNDLLQGAVLESLERLRRS